MCNDGVENSLLFVNGHRVCVHQICGKLNGEISVVSRLFLRCCAPQIMRQRCHTNNKTICFLALCNREGQMVHALHVLPTMRQILDAAKTLLYLFIDLSQYP